MPRLITPSLALVIMAASPAAAAADVQRPFSLETQVRLAGSSRNNTRYLATLTPTVDPVVRLTFRVDVPPSVAGLAELNLTPFHSENAPPVTFTLMEPTSDQPGIEGRPLELYLQPEPKVRHVDLRLQGLRPRTTYSLAQYFPSAGTVTFTASLVWGDQRIDVPRAGTVDVEPNDDYRAWASFQSVELAVTALAAVFAIVTGLGYGYNATFGTSSQYIGLFLWAAGASAGGNLFKQQGEGRTVGGQVAQLPTR